MGFVAALVLGQYYVPTFAIPLTPYPTPVGEFKISPKHATEIARRTLSECGVTGLELRNVSYIAGYRQITLPYWNTEFWCLTGNSEYCRLWVDPNSGRVLDFSTDGINDRHPSPQMSLPESVEKGWEIVRRFSAIPDLKAVHIQRYGSSILMDFRGLINGKLVLNNQNPWGYHIAFNPAKNAVYQFENYEGKPQVDLQKTKVTKRQAMERFKPLLDDLPLVKEYRTRFAGKQLVGYELDVEEGYFVEPRFVDQFSWCGLANGSVAKPVWCGTVSVKRNVSGKWHVVGKTRMMVNAVTGDLVKLNERESQPTPVLNLSESQ